MSKIEHHQIVLRCVDPSKNSDKEYSLELSFISNDESIEDAELVAGWGKTGNINQHGRKGRYTAYEFEKILEEKLKKGYKVQTINKVLAREVMPSRMLTDITYLRRAFENSYQAQEGSAVEIIPISTQVQVRPGQVCPIW
jgi:predicted DNA-binding WGR domain protein